MASNEQVLIVDDSEDIRELLRLGLSQEGYSPVLASDGPEALEAFARLHPPIVVCDVMLPSAVSSDLNGFAVSARIKANDPDVIVIVMTGLTGNMTQVRLLDSHADKILTKPITPDQIAAEIKYIKAKKEAIKPKALKAPNNTRMFATAFAILFGSMILFLAIGFSGLAAVSYHFYAVEKEGHARELKERQEAEKERFAQFMEAMRRETDLKLAQAQGQINYLEPRVLTLEKELSRMHGEIGRRK